MARFRGFSAVPVAHGRRTGALLRKYASLLQYTPKLRPDAVPFNVSQVRDRKWHLPPRRRLLMPCCRAVGCMLGVAAIVHSIKHIVPTWTSLSYCPAPELDPEFCHNGRCRAKLNAW